MWDVLRAFGSYGFCKAHAVAFAVPTYQSAWLKAHHPAAFYAGLLTHDPGMYPKRLILDDARNHDVEILGLDINASTDVYRVEGGAIGRAGIRVPLTEVKGISADEVAGIIAGQPYSSLSDAWQRSGMSRPTAERIVVSGGFDAMYGLGVAPGIRGRGRLTRRDLLLQVADLDRYTGRRSPSGHDQLALTLGDDPSVAPASGLPEMSPAERVSAELAVLGMDVSAHLVDFYVPMLDGLAAEGMAVVRSRDLLAQRSRSEVFVAGVKVATQTPPVRSGRRVIFLTLDDATGPIDATFFDDAQGPFAGTVFSSWLLLVRGEVRRTGPRGVSIRATGCWELGEVRRAWQAGGVEAVRALVTRTTEAAADGCSEPSRRRVLVHASGFRQSPYADIKPAGTDGRPAAASCGTAVPGSSGW